MRHYRKKLLDVGCGPGTINNIGYYEKVKDSFLVYGVDFIEKNIKLIKERFPQGSFFCARAERTPFPDSYFDAVLARHVLEHVDNPQKVLSEIHRVSKKGALVTIAVPEERLERFLSQLVPHYIEKGHHHQRIFTEKHLKDLLGKNGFHIKKVSKEKWPMFLILFILGVLSRFAGGIRMEEQTGVFTIKEVNYLDKKNFYFFYILLYRLMDFLNSSLSVLNNVIPFEIEVVAQKK